MPDTTAPAPPVRRRYESSLRRERAADTRRRIVEAATALHHESSVHDWRGLTVGAVAERAGVSERTVYRHFASERALRDAVMQLLEEQAGIDLGGLRLEGVAEAAARIFEHVAAYPPEPRPPLDQTLDATHRRQRDALLAAVAVAAPDMPDHEQRVAAAVLDVLWSVASYERLVAGWQFEPGEASHAVTWAIGAIEAAIRQHHHPTRGARK